MISIKDSLGFHCYFKRATKKILPHKFVSVTVNMCSQLTRYENVTSFKKLIVLMFIFLNIYKYAFPQWNQTTTRLNASLHILLLALKQTCPFCIDLWYIQLEPTLDLRTAFLGRILLTIQFWNKNTRIVKVQLLMLYW